MKNKTRILNLALTFFLLLSLLLVFCKYQSLCGQQVSNRIVVDSVLNCAEEMAERGDNIEECGNPWK